MTNKQAYQPLSWAEVALGTEDVELRVPMVLMAFRRLGAGTLKMSAFLGFFGLRSSFSFLSWRVHHSTKDYHIVCLHQLSFSTNVLNFDKFHKAH